MGFIEKLDFHLDFNMLPEFLSQHHFEESIEKSSMYKSQNGSNISSNLSKITMYPMAKSRMVGKPGF